jgi:hypothetical protein
MRKSLRLFVIVAIVALGALLAFFVISIILKDPGAKQADAITKLIASNDAAGSYALASQSFKEKTSADAWKVIVEQQSPTFQQGLSVASTTKEDGILTRKYTAVIDVIRHDITLQLKQNGGVWELEYFNETPTLITRTSEETK